MPHKITKFNPPRDLALRFRSACANFKLGGGSEKPKTSFVFSLALH